MKHKPNLEDLERAHCAALLKTVKAQAECIAASAELIEAQREDQDCRSAI